MNAWPHANSRSAVVIGAGPVGVCSAIYLQKEGFDVTLVDPRGPGEGCTGGNTGCFGFGYCAPQATPGIVKKVPKMLRDPMHPLKIRYSHALSALPWFYRFARASDPQRVAEISDSMSAILKKAEECYAPLIEESGASKLVRMKGRVWIYESEASLKKARYAHDLCRSHGVIVEELSSSEVVDFVPQLKKPNLRGAYMPGNGHVTSPLRFVQILAEKFVNDGGRILKEEATDVEKMGDGRSRVSLKSGKSCISDSVVIAAGAWSKRLAAKLGDRVPLEAERGYNMVLPNIDFELKQPIVLADRFVALTSMDDGLRLGGIAEYANIDAKPDYQRAERLFRNAMTLFGDISYKGSTRGIGPRPAVPDSLPIIGRSSSNPAVLYAFGHGHAGLTLGGITGRLVMEMAVDRETTIDISPYSPRRFAA
ncbi:FAD-binding oxidoreductase [Bradyrhizobium sp. AUGA SZCCT0431]|uniref:NAD(P)/FAD-dependent oxidoreductase n=1 Tax=Bradyrhizobium sp. AUGA SZCCT0431 TaxID=2807674 RepID=UPI001BA95BAB|nr:FAD-binding oxidoreductase [Bradyrhizobium sp. AUGA SZCCT0431]MBR1146168.1 FAD-binding oxidoreductase [Bradyrhizobium sp. AUGA SZCCT0431]